MTRAIRILLNPVPLKMHAPLRIYFRTEKNNAAQAPSTLPKAWVSRVVAGSPPTWSDVVSAQNTKNVVDDTTTINGALYYIDWTPTASGPHAVWVQGDIENFPRVNEAQITVDPDVPRHTHDGSDAPRVFWDKLKDAPSDLAGLVEETDRPVIVVDDVASQEEHDVIEAAVQERGYGDESTDPVRAGQILGQQAQPDEEVAFSGHFPVAPQRGFQVRMRSSGKTFTITGVEDLGGGRFRITAGRDQDDLMEVEQREAQRLRNLERYT